MRFVLPILTLITLTGCARSPEYRFAKHKEACIAYGYEDGSESMAKCMQSEEHAYRERLGADFQNMKAPKTQEPYMIKSPQRLKTSCTSNSIGDTVFTNCN